jgi:pyruvate dehydrogenase E1 component
MRRMLEDQQDVFYYITVMNENYAHPAIPEGAQDGILRGMYRLRESRITSPQSRVQLLGSGTILREVLAASELLEQDWGITADVWSVTSFTELRRDGLDVERHNRLRLDDEPKLTWVEKCLAPTAGPIIAASDYMRAVPDLIRPYLPHVSVQKAVGKGAAGGPRRYVALGTDGFGRSDTRAALRSFFEVDRHSIVVAALKALADDGSIERSVAKQALAKYGIDPTRPNPWDA